MNLTLDEGIAMVKQCWTDAGVPQSPGKISGLNALKHHLSNSCYNYSHETALDWISQNQAGWSKSKLMRCRRAVYELNDVMLYGEIRGEFKYHETPLDRLGDIWRGLLADFYSDSLSRITHRCAREQVMHCATMLVFMESISVTEPEQITVLVISKYYDYAESTGNGYICLYSCHYFLEFLVRQGRLPIHRPFAITAPSQAKGAAYALNAADTDRLSEIIAAESDTRLSPEEFRSEASRFVDYLHDEYGYDTDSLRINYTAHLQMLYVFMAETGVSYTSGVADYWMWIMKDFHGHPHYGMARHSSLHAFQKYMAKGRKFSVKSDAVSHHSPGKVGQLPEWAREITDLFLCFSASEGKTESTLSGYKSAAISFFLYADGRGITAPKQLTPQLMKDYYTGTSKTSSRGRKNYRYSIRQMLLYMYENRFTAFNLSLSLPSQCAQSRKIVDVLRDDEIRGVYSYSDAPETTMGLRDSCFLLIGLLMGLRSIDIVNLRFGDIDWKGRTISVTQQKTYRPVRLPMPVVAGNRIYMYIKSGRPESNSDYVFLSTKAPYGRAHRSACSHALYRAIGRGDFHVLRRTFATKLMNAGTGTDRIKDLLGHSTMDTVNRYLSVDENGMRECCLPLERMVSRHEDKV